MKNEAASSGSVVAESIDPSWQSVPKGQKEDRDPFGDPVNLDQDVWAVVDGTGVPQILPDWTPIPEQHQGSNVDLGEYAAIRQELEDVPHMMDLAFDRYRRGDEQLPDLRYQMRLHWARALEKAAGHGKSAAQVRADAELLVRGHKLEIERAEMARDVGQAAVKVYESRLSAAQTRARMWTTQYEGDVKRKQW